MSELFGAKIKRLREHLGLTQVQMGHKIGLSNTRISELEAEIAECSRITFQKFMEASKDTPFQLTHSDFFKQNPAPTGNPKQNEGQAATPMA